MMMMIMIVHAAATVGVSASTRNGYTQSVLLESINRRIWWWWWWLRRRLFTFPLILLCVLSLLLLLRRLGRLPSTSAACSSSSCYGGDLRRTWGRKKLLNVRVCYILCLAEHVPTCCPTSSSSSYLNLNWVYRRQKKNHYYYIFSINSLVLACWYSGALLWWGLTIVRLPGDGSDGVLRKEIDHNQRGWPATAIIQRWIIMCC